MCEHFNEKIKLTKNNQNKRYEGNAKEQLSLYNQHEFSNEIPIIIKFYESQNGFSKHIHNPDNNNQVYTIKGPFGVGLELTPESDGLHVIVAGGTGILPFMDLLNFLLMREMHRILL